MPISKIIYRVHAIKRMFQRGILERQIESVVRSGDVIETYPNDLPYPSSLILGWVHGKPLHVVVAENRTESEIIVITAYQPDPEKWDNSFRRRS